MLMGDPINPSGEPELFTASFGHFWALFYTSYGYSCTDFSTLTAHFEAEFSTPHPSLKTILGPCVSIIEPLTVNDPLLGGGPGVPEFDGAILIS